MIAKRVSPIWGPERLSLCSFRALFGPSKNWAPSNADSRAVSVAKVAQIGRAVFGPKIDFLRL